MQNCDDQVGRAKSVTKLDLLIGYHTIAIVVLLYTFSVCLRYLRHKKH